MNQIQLFLKRFVFTLNFFYEKQCFSLFLTIFGLFLDFFLSFFPDCGTETFLFSQIRFLVRSALPGLDVLQDAVRALALVQPGVSAVPHQLTPLHSPLHQEALEGVAAQEPELVQAQQTCPGHMFSSVWGSCWPGSLHRGRCEINTSEGFYVHHVHSHELRQDAARDGFICSRLTS